MNLENISMVKKFVVRESTREGGNLEVAYELNKQVNYARINQDSKKELVRSSNLKS